MKPLLTIPLLLVCLCGWGQELLPWSDSLKTKYSMSTVKERYEPGEFHFLQKHIEYPKELKNNGVFGMVYFQALIDTTGELMSYNVLRSEYDELSQLVKEALIKAKADWIPMEENGNKVPFWVQYNLYFELR